MKCILQFISSARSGWYSGKGFKASKQGKYEKALSYFELALMNTKDNFDPVVYDSMAIAYYKLNRYEEALTNAEKSYDQYQSIGGDDPKIKKRINTLKELIDDLRKSVTQPIA